MHPIVNFKLSDLSRYKGLFIIDRKVYDLYHADFALLNHDNLFLVEDIHHVKSWDSVLKIIDFFNQKNIKTEDEVYAIGGGNLTDCVGFAASIFKRGVHLIVVPTTLLAMVDAAIGGKNSINYQGIKNLLGTFYPPKKVMINLDFLNSLSKKELLSGLAEMLKLGLVSSKQLWDSLNDHTLNEALIKQCIEKKLQITTQDPFDKSLRHILNFGHTIGHAYEACSQKEHGFCVALGLLAESYIGCVYGSLSQLEYGQIQSKIKDLYGSFPMIDFKQIEPFLYKDKKNQTQSLKIHFLEKIGQHPKLCDVSSYVIQQGYESVWI